MGPRLALPELVHRASWAVVSYHMDRSSTGTSHKNGEENRKGERDYLTRIDIDRDVVR